LSYFVGRLRAICFVDTDSLLGEALVVLFEDLLDCYDWFRRSERRLTFEQSPLPLRFSIVARRAKHSRAF
jgi:hypothetical protein